MNKTDYQGITGHLNFASNGDLPKGSGVVNLFQVQKAADRRPRRHLQGRCSQVMRLPH